MPRQLRAPRRIGSAEALRLAPALRAEHLRGAIHGWDGQLIDDARLVVAVARTAANTGPLLVIAINYGSQAELALAAQELARRARDGEMAVEAIDADAIRAARHGAGSNAVLGVGADLKRGLYALQFGLRAQTGETA